MTKYVTLMNKAELCRKAAKKTKGTMQKIWIQKAESLEFKANSLSLAEVINESK